MALNIVRLNYAGAWEINTFEEGEYKETPKRFNFKSESPYFNHVDKDKEGMFSYDGWDYIYSRTLSVNELKERLVNHYITVWQNEYDSAKKSLDHFKKMKDNL